MPAAHTPAGCSALATIALELPVCILSYFRLGIVDSGHSDSTIHTVQYMSIIHSTDYTAAVGAKYDITVNHKTDTLGLDSSCIVQRLRGAIPGGPPQGYYTVPDICTASVSRLLCKMGLYSISDMISLISHTDTVVYSRVLQ